MTLPQTKIDEKYSYADYLCWDDQERWELINGDVWDMSPAPSRLHQEISIRLSSLLYQYFKEKDCSVYAAPFDVRLPEQDKAEDHAVTTVVQPDISVICDRKKLDERGCVGAPDLVIEILSPATAAKDLKVKRVLHGVRGALTLMPALVHFRVNAGTGGYEKARGVDLLGLLLGKGGFAGATAAGYEGDHCSFMPVRPAVQYPQDLSVPAPDRGRSYPAFAASFRGYALSIWTVAEPSRG